MIQKIAVIGATGMLGKPVTIELVNSGFAVTALVRDGKTASLPSSVSLVKGDIRDRSSIEKLLKGQDALYVSLNIKQTEGRKDFHTESDGLRTIIEIARKAGIRRIALISSLVMRYHKTNNFNWWVFDIKHEAVRLVRESGIPYTIFYPSTFMESLNSNYRQGNFMMLAGESHYKMYFISAHDYGKQVARSFQILDGENKEYVIQGPEAFTADEAVNEYVKRRPGRKLKILKSPIAMLRLAGMINRKMNYGFHILTALNNYAEKFEAENTWIELGTPATTIKSFAEEQ